MIRSVPRPLVLVPCSLCHWNVCQDWLSTPASFWHASPVQNVDLKLCGRQRAPEQQCVHCCAGGDGIAAANFTPADYSPPLASGNYTLRAVFHPANGAYCIPDTDIKINLLFIYFFCLMFKSSSLACMQPADKQHHLMK